jgi:hypothetical protein
MRGRVGAMRDRGVSHHEQLFYDAGRRRLRQEEYEAWQPPDHTFHPNAHRGGAGGGHLSLSSSMDGGASFHGWNVNGSELGNVNGHDIHGAGELSGSLPPHNWAPPVVNHAAVAGLYRLTLNPKP